MSTLPPFSLRDVHGQTHAFPAARPALLCFVRADCPTCGISMPLIQLTGLPAPAVEWSDYPEWRPGCGSRSVEPDLVERLQAEASGSPLRARRIEIAAADDEFEFMFDQGLSDGLPLVPPTPER